MTKTRKIFMAVLVAVLLTCACFSGVLFYSKESSATEMDVDREVYQDAEHTLMDFLGIGSSEHTSGTLRRGQKSKHSAKEFTDDGSHRLTQRVTIESDNGILPISGTVSKDQNAYYPGTYEVKFSNKALLTSTATVHVNLNIDEGEQVYVLTGDRDSGYTQYTTVISDANGCISFNTAVIQDYTISTTDIMSAQAAMASVMTN